MFPRCFHRGISCQELRFHVVESLFSASTQLLQPLRALLGFTPVSTNTQGDAALLSFSLFGPVTAETLESWNSFKSLFHNCLKGDKKCSHSR